MFALCLNGYCLLLLGSGEGDQSIRWIADAHSLW